MSALSWAFLVDSVPFTKAVKDGQTSLGGSESACLGLARALKARGHDVHVFATKLSDDAVGADAWGVSWHPLEDFADLNQFIEWDVVVGLRMFSFFANPIHARLRVLWNQDLLLPHVGEHVMGVAWALDKSVYVSEYHRAQWEDVQPELKPIGAVTRNGFDPTHVPATFTKDPNRIIHISRPERGLGPILEMWPEMKRRKPDATLQVCRYASMYDGEGSHVQDICKSFDAAVAEVQEAVGGIEVLGSLNKAQLYQAIAEAAVMWYPGVVGFAETSCIAAIEAQANSTPFVGSLKGALPETAAPAFEAGHLIPGNALTDADYQKASIDAVLHLMDGCAKQSREYRDLQKAGRKHVENYTYAALAESWEEEVGRWFVKRRHERPLGILRRLLHEDDHTAAKVIATELVTDFSPHGQWWSRTEDKDQCRRIVEEAATALAFCDRVIQGKEQTAEGYAAHAIQDPLVEVEGAERFMRVAEYFEGRRRVLDVACGNGAGAIRFALDHPELHVVGLDYAAANIEHATDAAARAGVGERCLFYTLPVWDFDTNAPHAEAAEFLRTQRPFDGAFVGEFVEHVANCTALVDWIDQFMVEGARVVYTCPMGPFVELAARGMQVQRGHVHCFKQDDVRAVWGNKHKAKVEFFAIGQSQRLSPIGHWIVSYDVAPNRPAGHRDYAARVVRTRPLPRLSVGIIAKDVENDLGRCLASVWPIAEEIVIGDTGSTDGTKQVAEAYGAKVFDLPHIAQIEQGFAGARNAVLARCTGDWFLWIDADEQLMAPQFLRRYLDGAIYNGYVIHQHHLQLDAKPHYDVPVRLFRTGVGIEFYGCVHEQPQMGDCNGDIVPSLETFDLALAHTGYLTEAIRRDKMLTRNLPLLRRDQVVFPDRELGKVLVLRDCINLADYEVEARKGMTEKAHKGYSEAKAIFEQYFDDPHHKYHGLARPWYEVALRRLHVGYEVEVSLAGRLGGLEQRRAKPERIWVRDADEFERYLSWKTTETAKKMRAPALKTDPFVLPPQGVPA